MALAPDHSVDSFEKLSVWLNGMPDQTDIYSLSRCEAGEDYKSFFQSGYARRGDENVVESMVAAMLRRQIEQYFEGRHGRIYWRVRLETEVSDAPVIVRFDAEGPDVDLISEQRCVMDHNLRTVKALCRLYRASHKLPNGTPF